jgi:PAS domain-containing protein
MPSAGQRPLELILARNLMASLSTPALLVNREGDVVFFNDAAGAVLGRRFEETGPMSAHDWVETYGPLDDREEPIPVEEQPITAMLRRNKPGHARERIRTSTGAVCPIAVSGVPVISSDGMQGAMVFFWKEGDGS